MSLLIFSHKNPDKLLVDHLGNVYKIGCNLWESGISRNFSIEDELLVKVLKYALLLHDFGKATPFFQDKLFDRDYHVEKAKHGLISAIAACSYLNKSLTAENVQPDIKNILIGICFLIVKRHHGDFDNIDDEFFIAKNTCLKEQFASVNLDFFYKLLCNYGLLPNKITFADLEEIIVICEDLSFDTKRIFNKEHYVIVNLLFSILISADKGDCILGVDLVDKNIEQKIKFDVVDIYKRDKFKNKTEISIVRDNIYLDIQNEIDKLDKEFKILSINVPTGTGKTLASFNAALKLKQKFDLKKIIYCLPFTSVIDQNMQVFENVLDNAEVPVTGEIIIKHHHLSDIKYKKNGKEEDVDKAEYLIETWNSQIIVTTFYQLLYSFFTNKNRNLKKFYNLRNSIVILDEVQSLDYKYWLLINEMFKFLSEKLNIYFVFVTATMPLIFSEEKKEIRELMPHKIDYFNKIDRIILDISLLKQNEKLNIESFCAILVDDIKSNRDKSFLIVLNTVNSSIEVLSKIKDNINDREVIYLSSCIIPKHRIERIKMIQKENKKFIVISTQLVEAGVDIDFDIVYRDFAPLDSIYQVCGRCNREGNKNKKGIVKLVSLVNKNGKNFWSFIYDAFLINETIKVFEFCENIIKESSFYNLSHNYFDILVKNGRRDDSKDLLTD
ncbi:MAG: CRISPR-associated helicase Cas3', partial [Candidatus Margulisbacteria bacterium]|nr:CRISPR-associated helicase Cas3' [Candidatus Margulisiibacteriota bacterium]